MRIKSVDPMAVVVPVEPVVKRKNATIAEHAKNVFQIVGIESVGRMTVDVSVEYVAKGINAIVEYVKNVGRGVRIENVDLITVVVRVDHVTLMSIAGEVNAL